VHAPLARAEGRPRVQRDPRLGQHPVGGIHPEAEVAEVEPPQIRGRRPAVAHERQAPVQQPGEQFVVAHDPRDGRVEPVGVAIRGDVGMKTEDAGARRDLLRQPFEQHQLGRSPCVVCRMVREAVKNVRLPGDLSELT